MKIPQILANTDAPSTMPTGQGAGLEYAGIQERQIQRSLTQLGNVASDLGELERKKQDRAARQEAGVLSSQADMESAAFLENLKLVTGDPDEYKAKAEEGLRGISERTLQSTKNEQTRALLQGELRKVGGHRALEALKYSNDLFTGQQIGRMENELANRKVTMSLLDPDDDGAWVEQFQKGVGSIDNARPYLRDKTDAAIRKWKSDVAYERAYRGIQADPDTNVERYRPLMDPKDWDRIEAKQTSLIKSRNAEADKQQAKLEKELEEERQGLLADARQRAYAGDMTVSQLDDLLRMRVVRKGDEYATLYRVITTEAKDAPSDPVVLQRVDIAVHQQVPRITASELDSLLGKGLSRKDWKEAKDKLVSRQTALANADQAQAEQLLRATVGKGPMDSYDDQDGQLFNIALKELTARSNAFPQYGGKEKPLDVAREIADRIAPIRQKRLKLDAETIGRSLEFRAPTADLADESLKKAAQMGLIDPNSNRYNVQMRMILDMRRREQEAEAIGGKSTGSSSSSGSKPPKRRTSGSAED